MIFLWVNVSKLVILTRTIIKHKFLFTKKQPLDSRFIFNIKTKKGRGNIRKEKLEKKKVHFCTLYRILEK